MQRNFVFDTNSNFLIPLSSLVYKRIKKSECVAKTQFFSNLFNFNDLFQFNFTIFLNFYMISNGNIWKLQYFLFLFFLLDRSFLTHPSIILRLILKIKRNEFFGCPCSCPTCKRKKYFSEPCFQDIFCDEQGYYPLPLLYFHILLESAVF